MLSHDYFYSRLVRQAGYVSPSLLSVGASLVLPDYGEGTESCGRVLLSLLI